MDQRDAERSYGVAEADLTPAVGWNLPALRRAWNAAKDQVAPWWRECSKEAYNTGLDNLARALGNWRDSRRADGPAGGWVSPGSGPGGAPRRRCGSPPAPSASSPTAATSRCPAWDGSGCTSRPANSPAGWTTAPPGSCRPPCAARPAAGSCRFTCAVQRAERTPARPASVVGVDVGVTHLAVLSTGELCRQPAAPERPRPGGCGAWHARSHASSGPTGAPGSGRRTGGHRARTRPGPRARPGGQPAPRRPAQTHIAPGRRVRHDRGRRPERRRHGPQPPAGESHLPTAASARSAANSTTRPPGTAGGSSSPTAGTPPPKPVRPAAR